MKYSDIIWLWNNFFCMNENTNHPLSFSLLERSWRTFFWALQLFVYVTYTCNLYGIHTQGSCSQRTLYAFRQGKHSIKIMMLSNAADVFCSPCIIYRNWHFFFLIFKFWIIQLEKIPNIFLYRSKVQLSVKVRPL